MPATPSAKPSFTSAKATPSAPVIQSAIIPVGGLGTRMLPTTNAVAKNMLTVGLKPLIQYAVEEAVMAGCSRIHIICSKADIDIYRNHFNLRSDIAVKIDAPGKEHLKARVATVTDYAPLLNFIVEDEPKGLGQAVAMARDFIDGTFAVILPDDLILNGVTPSALKDMADHYTGGIAIAAMPVKLEHAPKYGIFSFPRELSGTDTSITASGIIEKPDQESAPSNMAAVGRYILPYEVMEVLADTKPGAGGEIQLTDALDRLHATGVSLHAVRFQGTRYDCGDPEGFLRAQHAVTEILLAPKATANLYTSPAPAYKSP